MGDRLKFDAVLFDCDGVLVDSEPITNGVLRDMLAELGWELTPHECMRLFIGKAVKDEWALIESRIGRSLDESWLVDFRARRDQALRERVQAVPGAAAAVQAAHRATGGRVACASGADRPKVEMQLRTVGLMPYFDGRVFSGHELPRSKPAPDVYLAAASALAVHPQRCLVVEDSVTGVLAGVAAGATVYAYAHPDVVHASARSLLDAGAVLSFSDMAELAALVQD